jgi:hypothetical protein
VLDYSSRGVAGQCEFPEWNCLEHANYGMLDLSLLSSKWAIVIGKDVRLLRGGGNDVKQ